MKTRSITLYNKDSYILSIEDNGNYKMLKTGMYRLKIDELCFYGLSLYINELLKKGYKETILFIR